MTSRSGHEEVRAGSPLADWNPNSKAKFYHLMAQEKSPVFTQLNSPLHLETPKGAGWAHFVIDYYECGRGLLDGA
jgi:hypothetical protein